MSNYQGFMDAAISEFPHRSNDELSEQFYLLQLFEAQYTPEDGDLETYLINRLSSYHNQ